jgi:hypothetical protein
MSKFGVLAMVGAGLAVAAPAGPAAASCSHSWSNKSAETVHTIGSSVNLRPGPHTSCNPPILSMARNTNLYLHCYVFGTLVDDPNGGDGSTVWWHARIFGTQTQGWVSEIYLGGGGTLGDNAC